ncbi:diaminopropionate ammonia-lyase [Paroceanicella profunda]|uniref:Diaminopropionate ammonia-lyase n=1 Tax=Paroceanicella profunda TaxID=2579971 RepID=A0A5B8FIJ8_9RHOB|nr:diaminopropionate ammonia-lyase [Paroceanicella profunda]QDL93337.1 diaminopropionate ammonia-lyase [Paroceanicella profunda]
MYQPNGTADYGQDLAPEDAALLSDGGADRAQAIFALRPEHVATPLHRLAGLARTLGIADLHVKDEGARLGLGSFKALGGAYAVQLLVLEEAERRLGHPVAPEALGTPALREIAGSMTFACATDGNHGRSVAQGAQLCGAQAAIFVHSGVSDARVEAIARFGARMIRVSGSYDASVEEAARVAEAEGWTVVSDTSWPGYERIPGLVMQGYTVMVREALKALPAPPTHVFLQAGVGGFAAAVAGHMRVVLGAKMPMVIVVEPERAACLHASAVAGTPVRVAEAEPTVMAMLECYEPSRVAWRILSRLADGFLTLAEETSPAAMRRLARPEPGDPAVVAGESGGTGLAGLIRALEDPGLRSRLALGAGARVLVINTEGATDPALYERLVGLRPDQVAA